MKLNFSLNLLKLYLQVVPGQQTVLGEGTGLLLQLKTTLRISLPVVTQTGKKEIKEFTVKKRHEGNLQTGLRVCFWFCLMFQVLVCVSSHSSFQGAAFGSGQQRQGPPAEQEPGGGLFLLAAAAAAALARPQVLTRQDHVWN